MLTIHPLVALATCLATLFGGLLTLRYREAQHYWFAFSAGSLITVTFMDLLPESLSLGSDAGLPVRALLGALVVSFFLYSFLDRFFLTHHLHDDDAHGHPMGLVGAGSLVIHSFLDGVAIGAAFRAGAATGAIVATAVIVHDMTDGLNTVVVMLQNRQSAARARGLLVLDALAPLGGLVAVSRWAPSGAFLAYLLAFFCGEFLYLGAGSLLPETKKHGSLGITAALGLGGVLVALVTLLV